MHDDSNKVMPTEDDYRAADEVLRRYPILLDTGIAVRDRLAEFHQQMGASRFELAYRLRPPVNAREELDLDFVSQRISKEEYTDRVGADLKPNLARSLSSTFAV